MPSNDNDYISIADAAKSYPTSRRTIERRRTKARINRDDETLNAFIIRTKDGGEWVAPSDDLADKLTKDGRRPETFVSRDWLEKTFSDNTRQDDAPPRHSKTDDAPAPEDDAPVDKSMISLLRKELDVKNNQLDAKDKQIERKDDQIKLLNQSLQASTNAMKQTAFMMQELQSKIGALPPTIVSSASETPKAKPKPVDTTPRPQPVKRKPRSQAKPKSKTTPTPRSKKKSRLRSWLRM